MCHTEQEGGRSGVKSYCGDELKEACGPPRGVTLRSLLTGFREDFSNKNKVSSSNF